MGIPVLFSDEQKQYLQGFMTGAMQRGLSPLALAAGVALPEVAPAVERVYHTPVADLCKEERIKHELNGLDVWNRIVAQGEKGEFAEGGDVFRFKFHGLFYVTPAQEAYMLRLRIPGGILQSRQMRGLADLADRHAGGYADITTRANLQMREIMPASGAPILVGLQRLGLTARGSGADNVRNVTASPTAGFDAHELYDVRPLARALHHFILNHRELYGLPRKFNVAFDGGGDVSAVADTNDIGFYAVRVPAGADVAPGVYFRLQLGGITGHQQFASDTGLLLRPDECVEVAVAMIQVFIAHGDRTNRKKARLKYLLDDWGLPRFLEATETRLGRTLQRLPLAVCEPRRPPTPHGWLGTHAQRQRGLNYIGVCVPVGRMTSAQMRAIADVASTYGRGDIRLTVWQNLLLPDIPDHLVDEVRLALREIGFDTEPGHILGGLVACTGNAGCKFAAANTKLHAREIGAYLHDRLQLPSPINIHLTGCAHSCAQHYIGDIGMQAVKVKRKGESVEGYNLVLGGGADDQQGIARDFLKGLAHDEIGPILEKLLRHYLAAREADETFVAFTRRHDIDSLKRVVED